MTDKIQEAIEILRGSYMNRILDSFTNTDKEKEALQTLISYVEEVEEQEQVIEIDEENKRVWFIVLKKYQGKYSVMIKGF